MNIEIVFIALIKKTARKQKCICQQTDIIRARIVINNDDKIKEIVNVGNILVHKHQYKKNQRSESFVESNVMSTCDLEALMVLW